MATTDDGGKRGRLEEARLRAEWIKRERRAVEREYREKIAKLRDQSPEKPVTLSSKIAADLLQYLRDVVWHLQRDHERTLTMRSFVERSLHREIRRCERVYNQRNRFPPRASNIKMGRPIEA